MADKITIVDTNDEVVTIEVSTLKGIKQIAYPTTMTDKEIFSAVLNEIKKINKPPATTNVFLPENIGKDISIKSRQEKLPDEYKTVYYAEVKK